MKKWYISLGAKCRKMLGHLGRRQSVKKCSLTLYSFSNLCIERRRREKVGDGREGWRRESEGGRDCRVSRPGTRAGGYQTNLGFGNFDERQKKSLRSGHEIQKHRKTFATCKLKEATIYLCNYKTCNIKYTVIFVWQ